MADLSLSARLVYVSMVLSALLLSGCASKKALLKEGKLGVSEEKKEAALKLFKEGAEALYVDNQVALKKFDDATEVDPSLIPAYYNAGVAAEALDLKEEAKKRYEACLSHSKEEPHCLDNLLLIKAKLDEIESANQLAETYLNEYPEAPFVKAAIADMAFYVKDYARAEKFAREAIERDAENTEALYVMARIFFERKQYPAAKWVVKNALEHAPSHGGLYLLLGHVDMIQGHLHEALDAYANAVKFQPTEEALESYGLLLLKRGKVAEALPVLQRAVDARPLNFRNHLHLGNAYMANKMFDEARASYLKARELKPDDKDVDFNLGLLYFDLKPKDVSELERLKLAQTYFKAYLEQPGLKKDRIDEVNVYLKSVSEKIEMEEYRVQAEQESIAAPPPEAEEPPPSPEEGAGHKTEEPSKPDERAPEHAQPPVEEKVQVKPEELKKPKEKEHQESLQEEEEEFFEGE